MDEKEQTLKVMTFNIRHGRGRHGIKSPILDKRRVKLNLAKIARMMRTESPDVVMLQEVDRKFILTGSFDHGEYLGDLTHHPYRFTGEHSYLPLFFSYGTALFSKSPIEGLISRKLETNLGVLKKGYVLATTTLNQFGNLPVDLVSVHLVWNDGTPQATREEQARILVNDLKSRRFQYPLIIGGDFNCDSQADESTLDYIAQELDLVRPTYSSSDSEGYPSLKFRKCRDWIMVSQHFNIKSCRYVPEKLSDHYPIIAELTILKPTSLVYPSCRL